MEHHPHRRHQANLYARSTVSDGWQLQQPQQKHGKRLNNDMVHSHYVYADVLATVL